MAATVATVALAATPTLALAQQPQGAAAVTATAAAAATTQAPTTTPADDSWVYSPVGSFSSCAYDQYNSAALNCDDSTTVGTTIRVNFRKQSWRPVCAEACAALTALGTPCNAVVYRGAKFNVDQFQGTCTFRACTPEVGGALVSVPNDVTTLVLRTPQCLASAAPTGTPTTMMPTRSPTRKARATKQPTPAVVVTTPAPSTPTTLRGSTKAPSSSPIPNANPTSPPTFPPFVKLDPSLFTRVTTDLSMCIIPRVSPSKPSLTMRDFQGNANDCLLRCQLDAACGGVMFSAQYKLCVKAGKIETYDNEAGVDTFLAQGWQTWVVGDLPPPYMNMYCSQYVWSKSCVDDPECAWNGGLKGANDVKAYDRGYCGRTKCVNGLAVRG